MSKNISTLIDLLAKGDESAFRQVYDQYHQKIYAIGYYLTHSRVIAEDITQDVFIKLWNKKHELATVQNFDSWIKVLTKNHAYNIIAKAAREQAYKNQPVHNEVAGFPGSPVEKKEQAALIKRAINLLPAQQKRAYILSREEGYSASEIAVIMGLSVNTVKNHLKAATASIISFCKKNIDLAVLVIFLSK